MHAGNIPMAPVPPMRPTDRAPARVPSVRCPGARDIGEPAWRSQPQLQLQSQLCGSDDWPGFPAGLARSALLVQ